MDKILSEAIRKFKDALDYLHIEYSKLQTGRASVALVDSVMVESYGTRTPLKGVASISIPEPTQVAIQPWDKSQLVVIEKAILEADLGLRPGNDGSVIRLTIPPMTEERRKELVKLVHKYAEDARISVRNARHEALHHLKQMEKNKEVSEDELKGKEKDLQIKVDEFNVLIEEALKHKEGDVMTV